MRRALASPLLLLLLGTGGCGGEPAATTRAGGFENRTLEAGITFRMTFLEGEQGRNFKINLYDHGAGVAVADYDGDGDDDLYFCNQLGPNALYRNDGKGAFTDVTAEAGPLALADRICVCAAFNDYDNDGDQDLYVTSTRGGNVLFRNEGNGRFRDQTLAAGLAHVGHSQGAAFFDGDGDGDLDLFVTNTATWTSNAFHAEERYFRGAANLTALVGSPIELNLYYRNNGDGTFLDQTVEVGLHGVGWGGDMAIFDFDEDGDADLFMGNMFGSSILYRNDGSGHFADVTAATLGKTPWGTVGAKPFDYDGDGHLDLFVVDMHSDMWMDPDYDVSRVEPERKYGGFHGRRMEEQGWQPRLEWAFAELVRLRYDKVFFGNALFRNTGEGRFEERSADAKVETLWPWGVASGDFDGDGHQDVFLPSGMGFPFFYWRSPLLRNRGDGTFEEISAEAGVDPPPGGEMLALRIADRDCPRSSRSAATGDFDGDGRLDLVVNNFNDAPYLLMNRWPARSWVSFRLRGTQSNRDAVGAVVRLTVGDRLLVRQVDSAGGYLAQSSKTLHFALGDAKKIDRCEVRWPGGKFEPVDPPALNRVHSLVEGEE